MSADTITCRGWFNLGFFISFCLCIHVSVTVCFHAAVVLWKENEAPKVEEIHVDAPKRGEVRIKMLYASICHTDVLGLKGFPTV